MEQKIRRDRNMGDNLKHLRQQKRVSQEKLCAELQRRGCDIGRTTYAKYESGELNIRASVLIELKKIYDCSYDDFFAGLDTKYTGRNKASRFDRFSFYSLVMNCMALLAIRRLVPFVSKAISISISPPSGFAETIKPSPNALCRTRSPTLTAGTSPPRA